MILVLAYIHNNNTRLRDNQYPTESYISNLELGKLLPTSNHTKTKK